MFWKKDKSGRPSPREELTAEIERLSAGQVLRFRLPEIYGGGFGVIEINPGYPGKGGRYLMNTETAVDSLPSGKKSNLFDTNKAGVLASWMLDRNGERYS